MPPNLTSVLFLSFYAAWLVVGLYALVAVIRGMRALLQIPEHLQRIEQLLERRGSADPIRDVSAASGEPSYYTRYDAPDDRAP